MRLPFVLHWIGFIFCAAYSVTSEASECAAKIASLGFTEPRANFTSKVRSYRRVTVTAPEVKKNMGVDRELSIVEITTLPSERLTELEIFTDQADLTLLIDVTGNTQGHMAHMVRGDEPWTDGPSGATVSYRYDGRLFWNRQDVKKGDWRFSDGLIIRYPKVPKKYRKRLVDLMESSLSGGTPIKVFTCVQSTHEVLYKVAGFNPGQKYTPWFPSTFLKHLARTGLLTEEGERLAPEIYTLNRDYRVFWSNLPYFGKIWKFLLPVLMNPATWGMRQFQQ